MTNSKKKNTPDLNANRRMEKYIVIGKLNYIYARPGVTVFDNRGKRRIGKNNRVQVTIMDRVVYNDENEYKVVDFDEKYTILEKI